MKRKTIEVLALLAAFALLNTGSASALDEARLASIRAAVSQATPLEIAPVSANLVKKAEQKDQNEVTAAVVKAAIANRPTLALSVVVAISEAVPAESSIAAAAASQIFPQMAQSIAIAATKAAPDQAAKIAAAVVSVAPKNANLITEAIAAIVPSQTDRIVEAVVTQTPSTAETLANNKALTTVATLAAASGDDLIRKAVSTTPGSGVAIPPTGTNVFQAPRSQSLQQALSQFSTLQQLPSPVAGNTNQVTQGDLANVTIAGINTINAINRDTNSTKQVKDAIIGSTSSNIVTLASSTNVSSLLLTNAVSLITNSVITIVADTNLDPGVKAAFASFVATNLVGATVTLSTNSSGNTSNQLAGLQASFAVNTNTVAAANGQSASQATNTLASGETTAGSTPKAYGSP